MQKSPTTSRMQNSYWENYDIQTRVALMRHGFLAGRHTAVTYPCALLPCQCNLFAHKFTECEPEAYIYIILFLQIMVTF